MLQNAPLSDLSPVKLFWKKQEKLIIKNEMNRYLKWYETKYSLLSKYYFEVKIIFMTPPHTHIMLTYLNVFPLKKITA